jgi:PhzF family phenazine biosynthesis protein
MNDVYENVLSAAQQRSADYLKRIRGRQVGVGADALKGLSGLGGDLSTQGTDPVEVLALLDELGSPATVATTSGRFFGFVVGGALPAAVGASWLATAWDQNACLWSLSPVAARLEEIVLNWLLDLFALPKTCGGAFVTGAQMATFTALAAARHSVLRRVGWNVERDGMFGAPPVTVVVGEEVHVTVLKALAMLGFGRDRVISVPADLQGRIQVAALSRVVSQLRGPAIICAQVGNVNTGACDPIGEICGMAQGAKAWVHVDGAFGLWAAAAPTRKHLVERIALADSWATDAHKWLNVPQDSGVAIVRDADSLRAAMAISAEYLSPCETREPMQFVPESSRRARAVEIWAALRSLGRDGVAELIERTCQHANVFAEELRGAGYDVLNDVVLNQVLVSFGDDDRTIRIIRAIQDDGTCWCGGTLWKGRKAMRISVSSWATTDEDVALSLDAIIRIAKNDGLPRTVIHASSARVPTARSCRFIHLDVFTNTPLTGNQLAVFLQPEGLSSNEMMALTREMAFSETTFVLPAEAPADFRVRIFGLNTGGEILVAGHPTIGTVFALANAGRIQAGRKDLMVGLGIGPTKIDLEWAGDQLKFAWMGQRLPEFGGTISDVAGVAGALGIDPKDIASTKLPIQQVSCGAPFVMVPVSSRAAVDRSSLNREAMGRLVEAAGVARRGVFIFSTAPGDDGATLYSRMFGFGVVEDPATGNASGPAGCYLAHYKVVSADTALHMTSRQGVKMGRSSEVHIGVEMSGSDITKVRIGGSAVQVATTTIKVGG